MPYELFTLDKEINIICLQADVFPHGITDAFERLKQKIVSTDDRTFYGVSWMDKTGNIIYKAGVIQIRPQEAEKLDCEEFRIRKGLYISFMVYDFKLNASVIADIFRQMLKDPSVDPAGYCVEIYIGQAVVQCMVTARQKLLPKIKNNEFATD